MASSESTQEKPPPVKNCAGCEPLTHCILVLGAVILYSLYDRYDSQVVQV
jgi:hypothetical protein